MLTDVYGDVALSTVNWRVIFRQTERELYGLDICATIEEGGIGDVCASPTPDHQQATFLGGAHRG